MLEVLKEADNAYRFQLINPNGHQLFSSVPFNDEKALQRVVATLKPMMHLASVFERKTDYEGKFLFYLKNEQGTLIGKSRLYDSEAGMENGIKNLKKQISALTDFEGS